MKRVALAATGAPPRLKADTFPLRARESLPLYSDITVTHFYEWPRRASAQSAPRAVSSQGLKEVLVL